MRGPGCRRGGARPLKATGAATGRRHYSNGSRGRLTDGKRIGTMLGMASTGFTYWQAHDMWLGYLDEFPDYMTQGTSLDDLKEHLLDLF
jgi:hypothetical protein